MSKNKKFFIGAGLTLVLCVFLTAFFMVNPDPFPLGAIAGTACIVAGTYVVYCMVLVVRRIKRDPFWEE